MRAWWLVGFGGVALLACGALVGDSEGDLPARAPAEEAGAADAADLDAGVDVCTPRTCAELGATCGTAADECGDSIPDCGTCSGTEFCGGGGPNKCGSKPCEAGTCAGGGQCGAISDGCNATLQCGCGTGEVCQARTCVAACIAQGACDSVTGVDCTVGSVNPGQQLYMCAATTGIQPLPSADCTLCRKAANNPPPGVFYCCP